MRILRYPMSRRALAAIVWIAVATCSTGCGSKPAVVTGTVTYQGKPLTGGSVILYCADDQIVRGVIGPDGAYTIPNVPRGVCRVTVKTYTPIPAGFRLKQELPPVHDGPIHPSQSPALSGEAVPERYAVPEESGLTVRVDRPQTIFDITLTP